MIDGEILHNYGNIRQPDISVGVEYGTDLDKALAAVHGILKDNPHALADPASIVAVKVLSNSVISISVKPWVRIPDYVQASGEISREIVIPFPQWGRVANTM